ncbi:MAG: hypothetical protein WC280_00970 [Patescibacteria group bacterium]
MREFYGYSGPELNIEGKSGVELELNYLGNIKNGTYNKKTKEALYDVFIAEEFSKSGSRGIVSANNLVEVKKQRKALYEELKSHVESGVERVFNERVVKNRHKYLKEISIEDQFKIVEGSQVNEDPSDPPTEFAGDLHATIASKMNLEDYSDLEYYSAVGSHLDYCGVDGFFKFKKTEKNGEPFSIRVAFDLTMDTEENKKNKINEKTRNGGKYLADIILYSKKESYREAKSNFDTEEDFKKGRAMDEKMINSFADKIIEAAKSKGF